MDQIKPNIFALSGFNPLTRFALFAGGGGEEAEVVGGAE